MISLKEKAHNVLRDAGVTINGAKPWDIHIHDERFYRRVLSQGSIALGESYVDGWWDAERLDEFFFKILRARLDREYKPFGQALFHRVSNALFNQQSPSRSFHVGERHYDIGNDLYQAMLDTQMVYTCGYWKNARTLGEAQEEKLDLVCRKINLRKGKHVLDIGCGWGSFAKFAAEKYGARVTGLTVSKEQAALARERTRGLPVEILFQDYRDVEGTFDHIVSLGMFEHVGPKNYRTYMRTVSDHLKNDGLFLLHTIGSTVPGTDVDPWIDKYIFPNGVLPRPAQLSGAASEFFVIEDWHSFGPDYDKTLMAWNNNFESHWGELKKKHSERFHRMWRYYLLSCAGAFRARDIQLWQIVLSKDGVLGGYESVR